MSCSNGMSFFPPNYLLQNSYEENHHPQSLLPQDLHVSGFTSFLGKRSPVNNIESCCDLEDDNSDEGSQMGDKKRRLNMEQVKTLEKNFELGNKLEPERKMQLARALGLQPRQIAIWFQNRRARWKTKQLEKDYDTLKRQFDNLKAENEILQTHNHKLQLQIMALKNREPTESINLNKDTEGSCSNRSDNSSDNLRLDISTAPPSMDSTLTGGQPTVVVATDGRQLFPPSSAPTATTMQFFQNSSSGQSMVKEENSISNMFCGMDDQSGFWPWLDNQQYH